VVTHDPDSPPLDKADAGIPIDEAALQRKIDFRVLPMLFLIYVAAFLDR
jgi:hypothetical protein